MIKSIRCDQSSFRTVRLKGGMNIILADRTHEETRQDSRNGLGKSSLIEVIHFCLGSDFNRSGLTSPALHGWTFSLDLEIGERLISISRNTEFPREVLIRGDMATWQEIEPELNRDDSQLTVEELNSFLGERLFGISPSTSAKYQPRFRNIISYFIRRISESYLSPFEHHKRQRVVDTQMSNAFLLGLGYNYAFDFQSLKDQEKELSQLKKLSVTGSLGRILGSMGELQALLVRLEKKAHEQLTRLQDFRVHEDYNEIAQKSDQLTTQIQEAAKDKSVNQRLLNLYTQNLNTEHPRTSSEADVVEMYQSIGIEVPEMVVNELDRIKEFHHTVIENRRSFLQEEIANIELLIRELDNTLKQKIEERASLMTILNSHGALEEYNEIHKLHRDTMTKLNETKRKIELLEQIESGRSALRVQRENLLLRSRRHMAEQQASRNRAIELFNTNSQALYQAPGNLVIDIDERGYRFSVDIERSSSHGVENMKIFCYDLMLAQLWSERQPKFGCLIHDSTIFDGVDERQVAAAIEMIARDSEQWGFQYVCMMNSDSLPERDLSAGFSIDEFVRLRLNDQDISGCLFGVRF